MPTAQLDGADLQYEMAGSGEPLLLIHGSVIADAFLPLLAEPRLARNYRMISYHRRGYGGSSRATPPFPIEQQAADARALLRHLGVSHAHVVGHSYGGLIALELARDAPELVASLALLEPALVALAPSGPAFLEAVGAIRAMHQRGDRAGAIDAFLGGVLGPDYRAVLEARLPPGTLELAIADSDAVFDVELPALQQWSFGAADAQRLRPPVLAVVGDESEPIFHEIQALLKEWLPAARELRVPGANHALQYMNPRPVAEGLADFLARQPV